MEAFLSRLMRGWFDEITLDRVATDAGVTVQTVVRRFGGKDGLLASAVKVLTAQIDVVRESPQEGGVDGLIDHLVEDYERTGDAVLRLLALAPRHRAVAEVVEFGRRKHRRWVSDAFARELDALTASARRDAVDALVVVTDVYAWQLLRRDMKHSKVAVSRTLKRLVRATLAQLTNDDLEREER